MKNSTLASGANSVFGITRSDHSLVFLRIEKDDSAVWRLLCKNCFKTSRI
jgi:hypothetical protein